MVGLHRTLTIPQDLIHGLHNAVRRQAAVLLAQVHAATGGVHPDAQILRGGELCVQQPLRLPLRENVMVVGETSMGMQAVALAFIIPFVLLIFTLFLFMALIENELYAALLSLAVLVPYYYILWLNKTRLKQKFSFTIKPINN